VSTLRQAQGKSFDGGSTKLTAGRTLPEKGVMEANASLDIRSALL